MIAFGWHEIPDDIRADLHIFTLCKHDAVGPDIVDCIPGYDDAGAPADADAAMEFGEVRSRYGDRKSVVEGKSVSVCVDLGGRRIMKKKKDTPTLEVYRKGEGSH